MIRKIRAVYSSQGALEDALECSKSRLKFGKLLFVAAFLVITGRLVELTVFPKESIVRTHTKEKAEKKNQHPEFTDRNGVVIATTLKTLSMYANPGKVRHPERIAEELARIFPDLSEESIRKKLSQKGSFIWIKRDLTPVQISEVNAMGEPALGFIDDEVRVYPYKNLFSHVLGYVDIDNKGISGFEKTCDDMLMHGQKTPERIKLSMDVRVQGIVRDEIAKSMQNFSAIGAVGMVVDVNSGEIISMVNLPDFDPHKPGRSDKNAMFDRATLGVYEMGSTFKAITTAMALDSGKVSINGGFDASNPIKYASYTITDYHAKSRWLSVPEIFMYSSNIGTAKMALEVGGKSQQAFLKKLGILDPIDIGVPEKGRPLVPSNWSDLTTMTVAFGHGIAVTPAHMAQSVSALINGGIVNTLTVVEGGNSEKEGFRIIKPETSNLMRKLLRLVVEKGTGSKGDVDGYFVGGKTGTAEKVGVGGYNKNALVSSFVAAFPINDPKYLVLVILDEPKPTKETFGYATGGWTAAPTVSKIIERIGPMLGIQPIRQEELPLTAKSNTFIGDLKLASY